MLTINEAYDYLGVTQSATIQDVIKAYRKKAVELHPDKNLGRKEQAKEEFQNLLEAYELVSKYLETGLWNGNVVSSSSSTTTSSSSSSSPAAAAAQTVSAVPSEDERVVYIPMHYGLFGKADNLDQFVKKFDFSLVLGQLNRTWMPGNYVGESYQQAFDIANRRIYRNATHHLVVKVHVPKCAVSATTTEEDKDDADFCRDSNPRQFYVFIANYTFNISDVKEVYFMTDNDSRTQLKINHAYYSGDICPTIAGVTLAPKNLGNALENPTSQNVVTRATTNDIFSSFSATHIKIQLEGYGSSPLSDPTYPAVLISKPAAVLAEPQLKSSPAVSSSSSSKPALFSRVFGWFSSSSSMIPTAQPGTAQALTMRTSPSSSSSSPAP